MNQLSQYLTKLFANRDLAADAKTLGISEVILRNILAGKDHLGTAEAVAVSKLLNVSVRDILRLQTEDSLAALGVGEEEVKPAKKTVEKKVAQDPAPARGCLTDLKRSKYSQSAIL